MTTIALQPRTARDALFPRRDMTRGLPEVLKHSEVSAQMSRAVPHLSAAGRWELLRRTADAAAELLDLDLLNLVMQTLRTYQALMAAAERTAATPGSVEVVQLVSVPTPWQNQATVQLWMDETPCLRIHLQLDIVLELSLEATVKNGRLVALPNGRCTATVTLSAQGSTLVTGRTALDLPTALALGNGVPLTPAATTPRWP
jgi:hypothetical protein